MHYRVPERHDLIMGLMLFAEAEARVDEQKQNDTDRILPVLVRPLEFEIAMVTNSSRHSSGEVFCIYSREGITEPLNTPE
jgi:hypothetical protein